jgi:DNA topoisomerase II
MLAGGEKVDLNLTDVREYHTDTTVSFTLKMAEGQMAAAMKKGLHKVLKLTSSVATTNMTLFDEQGRIQKHNSATGVLRHFFQLRLSFYEKRAHPWPQTAHGASNPDPFSPL